MASLSVLRMREILKSVYESSNWDKKVDRMSDGQVYAVYMRYLREGKLKGYI